MRAEINRQRLKTLETAAFLLTVAAESALRGVYGGSGSPVYAGIFGEANGSAWEQMKILFFSYAVISLPVCILSGVDFLRMLTAKAASSVTAILLFAAFYYSYTGAIGFDYSSVDKACAFLATLAAFLLSYRLAVRGKGRIGSFTASACAFLMTGVMFCCFTLWPPQLPLFMDPHSGTYGLQKQFTNADAEVAYTSLAVVPRIKESASC